MKTKTGSALKQLTIFAKFRYFFKTDTAVYEMVPKGPDQINYVNLTGGRPSKY